MTEPTRDALHAETLEMLDVRIAAWMQSGTHGREVAAQYTYAAECVRVRADLEAEVERLRDELAVTAKILAERERECIALRPAYKATSYGPGLTIPTPRTDG